jgi:SAM-dependent methyltransferase
MSRYRDKLDWIVPEIEGRTVLYVGSVDEDSTNFDKHRVLNEKLQPEAASMLSVYQFDPHSAIIRQSGIEARTMHPERMELGGQFDVILALDNLEHLSNCGLFLAGLARHLTPDGSILLSTPNPVGLMRVLWTLVYGKTKTNRQHTCWFSEQVLDQLARRHGLYVSNAVFIDEMHVYYRTDNPDHSLGFWKQWLVRLVSGFNRIICPIFPQFSETLGFSLKRQHQQRGA